MSFSAQQQRWLAAMGYTLYQRLPPAATSPAVPATAGRPAPDPATDGLWQALRRATGRDPATLGLPPLEQLRASGAAKRALWPRLRALRRP